jgi:3-methyladenine DNA glycosylase AlkD
MLSRAEKRCHDEVLSALRAIGNPARGAAVQLDRGSALEHLGIGFPALRARVKQGFSFSAGAPEDVLAIWDALWRESPVAEVLFAAIEHHAPIVRKEPPAMLWPVLRHWPARVDNWCHSDALAGLFSRLLQAQPDAVWPDLRAWNAAEALWPRRLSITSLVHGSGKNAVFLAPGPMLPLLRACVDDHRRYIQLALGWVLRELGRAGPKEAESFLREHAAHIGALAWARASEGLDAAASRRLATARGRGSARA